MTVDLERARFLLETRRKRRLMLQTSALYTLAGSLAEMAYPDGVSVTLGGFVTLPWDWVRDTPIDFCAAFVQTATAGSPAMVYNSSIGCSPINTTTGTSRPYSNTNLENVTAQTLALTQNEIRELVRPIAQPPLADAITTFDSDYSFSWSLTRQGGHASDAVNGTVFLRGLWIEYYSTYDYQNLMSD